MVDFFIRKYNLLRLLMLADSEVEILDDLMKLFPDNVGGMWCMPPRRERFLAKAQEFLLGYGSAHE